MSFRVPAADRANFRTLSAASYFAHACPREDIRCRTSAFVMVSTLAARRFLQSGISHSGALYIAVIFRPSRSIKRYAPTSGARTYPRMPRTSSPGASCFDELRTPPSVADAASHVK